MSTQHSGLRPRHSAPITLESQGFSKRHLMTGAGQLAVFERGEGAPLLLLHGVGGGASSKYWYRIAPMLSERYRVIAPDCIGFGDSEHPQRSVGFDDHVVAFQALLADLNQPVNVVAQSLAAGFVIAAMREDPNVNKLILFAPTGGRDFGIDSFTPLVRNTLSRVASIEGLNRLFYRAFFPRRATIKRWFVNQGFYNAASVPDEIVSAGVYSAGQPNASYAILPFLTGDLRYDLSPLLREVAIPTLMVWGCQETQIKPEIRKRLERLNASITVQHIDRARTNFELEHPETTAALVTQFFAGE